MKEFIDGSFCKDFESKKPVQIRGNLSYSLGPVGCEGNIGFYDIEIEHRGKFEKTGIRVCVKELNQLSVNKHRESGVDEVLKKHSYLKEIGLPTVPICRGDVENNLILMTDMTQKNEKTIVDKHNPLEDSSIENIYDLENQLVNIARAAYHNDIFLSIDAYSIVVDKKTGRGKICLLDIGANTKFLDKDEPPISERRALEQIELFLELSKLPTRRLF